MDNHTVYGLNSSASPFNATLEPQDHPDCTLFKFILYGLLFGSVSLLGFVGNGLSFLVLLKDQSSPVASFQLQALAIADNCFLLLWLLHYSVRECISFMSGGVSSPLFTLIRLYSFPLLYMAQMETIWLTVVIATNRFMAVCMPYRAPKLCTLYNVYKEVFVVTLFSVLYNIPKFFERKVMGANSTQVWVYTEMGGDPMYKKIYNDWLYYVFTFILPLLILAVVNTKIIIAYQAVQQRRQNMTSRRQDDNNITLVMIMIVLVFMLCQGPARLVQIVISYSFSSCQDLAFYVIHISNTFEVLNSSLNFIIYFIFRKRFRDILVDQFCCCSQMLRAGSDKALDTEGIALTDQGHTNTNKAGSCQPLVSCTIDTQVTEMDQVKPVENHRAVEGDQVT